MIINVRCESVADFGSNVRCQLLVGHEGSHAAMVLVEHDRLIRVWTETGSPLIDHQPSTKAHQYPWAPGQPTVIYEQLPTLDPQILALWDSLDYAP